jgi:hypothetical protein
MFGPSEDRAQDITSNMAMAEKMCYCFVRPKIFMAMTSLMMFSWVKLLCGLFATSQYFREACCHYHQSWSAATALKMETGHFTKMMASTNQSTQRLNSKDHHQCYCFVSMFHKTLETQMAPLCLCENICKILRNLCSPIQPHAEQRRSCNYCE